MDARALWQLFEPVHALTYFDPVAREALQVKGFWNGYVVMRAAPLGPVSPQVVTAAFFGFHPRRAAAALPSSVSPAEALQVRSDGAVRALSAHVGDVAELADWLWTVASSADCAGRVLAAANQAVTRPSDPVAALWQATTTLREHRGDGHLAALIGQGIGPIPAMQLKVAAGESTASDLQLGRGWSAEQWAAGAAELEARGWVVDGELTAAGQQVRDDVEARTDRAAEQPWRALGADQVDRVVALLTPITASIWSSGVVPGTNPVGVTAP